jgi:hypothetical protein
MLLLTPIYYTCYMTCFKSLSMHVNHFKKNKSVNQLMLHLFWHKMFSAFFGVWWKRKYSRLLTAPIGSLLV